MEREGEGGKGREGEAVETVRRKCCKEYGTDTWLVQHALRCATSLRCGAGIRFTLRLRRPSTRSPGVQAYMLS